MTATVNNNFLVVGSGAREHVICQVLHRSPQEKKVFCLATNFNPGIDELCDDVTTGDIDDSDAVTSYAEKNDVGLAIIGPENPLACGVSDSLWEIGVKVVGPKKDLAQIETSKACARDLLNEYNIPACPEYKTFSSMEGVIDYLNELGENYVVKYDGLAGGKGVKVSGEHLYSHEEATLYLSLIHI